MLVPVVLLGAIGFLAWRSHDALVNSCQWVSHTLEVESHLARLQSLLTQAESAQRGFLLTQQADFQQPFRSAVESAGKEQTDLRSLTRDNASQQKRLAELQDMITRKVDEQTQTLALAQTGQPDAARNLIHSDAGERLSQQIRQVIGDAMAEERRLLDQRQEAMRARSAESIDVAGGLIGFAALTVGSSLYLLRRLQKNQALVHMCAWSKTIEHQGEWLSFEHYLERRFGLRISHGISPEEAVRFRAELDAHRPQVAP
jgi:CHASE3 domain sensor protein